jgi:hypothetical protein
MLQPMLARVQRMLRDIQRVLPGHATGVPGKCNACWSGEVDARTAAYVELPCRAGRVRGRERRADGQSPFGDIDVLGSRNGNFRATC